MPLYDHETNPIPVGAITGDITTPDGSRLRFARWLPDTAKPKGTVCLLQGRAEFIERYFETARDLLVRGFAVATFDWRGQGGSRRHGKEAHRGHVGDFEEYQEDLEAFMAQVVLPHCPPPFYGLAHSTGGLVLLDSAPAMRTRFRRIVLLAPLLGLGDHGWSESTAGPLARFLSVIGFDTQPVPGAAKHVLHLQPFEGNRLSSDERRFTRTRLITAAHPDLTVGAPTIGWVAAAMTAARRLEDVDFVDRIRIPTLIIAAGADRIVSNAAIERFARTLKIGHLLMIPGARHELLQEADIFREQVLAAFDAFVPGS